MLISACLILKLSISLLQEPWVVLRYRRMVVGVMMEANANLSVSGYKKQHP